MRALLAELERVRTARHRDDQQHADAKKSLPERARELYERESWSGCEGASWERMSTADQEGWLYAACLLQGGDPK